MKRVCAVSAPLLCPHLRLHVCKSTTREALLPPAPSAPVRARLCHWFQSDWTGFASPQLVVWSGAAGRRNYHDANLALQFIRQLRYISLLFLSFFFPHTSWQLAAVGIYLKFFKFCSSKY